MVSGCMLNRVGLLVLSCASPAVSRRVISRQDAQEQTELALESGVNGSSSRGTTARGSDDSAGMDCAKSVRGSERRGSQWLHMNYYCKCDFKHSGLAVAGDDVACGAYVQEHHIFDPARLEGKHCECRKPAPKQGCRDKENTGMKLINKPLGCRDLKDKCHMASVQDACPVTCFGSCDSLHMPSDRPKVIGCTRLQQKDCTGQCEWNWSGNWETSCVTRAKTPTDCSRRQQKDCVGQCEWKWSGSWETSCVTKAKTPAPAPTPRPVVCDGKDQGACKAAAGSCEWAWTGDWKTSCVREGQKIATLSAICRELNHASCDAKSPSCKWAWNGDWKTSCVVR